VKLYRIMLRVRGSFMTPWQSDTLYGSLCWELRRLEGEEALEELLELCKSGSPPFVLSDGFPGDLLPTPLCVYRLCRSADGDERKRFELAREWKRRALVPLRTFAALCRGELPELPDAVEPTVTATRLHATLDRRSNTTLDEGGLREETETWLNSADGALSVYARVKDEWVERLETLWRALAGSGFGKKKSAGKGAFDYIEMAPAEPPAGVSAPDGFVSLSHFVPAAGDPTDGDYATLVKQGKLGEGFGLSDNPFKRPLLLLTPGSCFRTGEAPKEWYGRCVTGLAPEHPEAAQLAFCLAVGIRFPGG